MFLFRFYYDAAYIDYQIILALCLMFYALAVYWVSRQALAKRRGFNPEPVPVFFWYVAIIITGVFAKNLIELYSRDMVLQNPDLTVRDMILGEWYWYARQWCLIVGLLCVVGHGFKRTVWDAWVNARKRNIPVAGV